MEQGILTLTLLSVFTILGGIVATKFKLPPALGLLVVGAVMGPSGLGYLGGAGTISWLIEIGAVVLLFITGLEFDINKLKTIGAKSFVGALFKIGIVFFMTYHTTILFGFGVATALFLALILSFSSTIVIVKVLEQHQLIQRKETPFLLGMLIAEDLFAILALSFIVSVKPGSTLNYLHLIEQPVLAMIILLGLYIAGLMFLPNSLKWVLRNTGDESLLFIDLALCLGFALVAEVLGLSSGIGAFLAGSVVASLPHAKSLGRAIAPFSMIPSALFFLSIGTLVDLPGLKEHAQLLGLLTIIVIASRMIAVTLVTNIFANFKEEQTVFSSFAMFSVGEFSLLIARHTTKLSLDVDLISISAAIIFITSIIMSFSIKRTTEGALLIKTFLPSPLRHGFRNLQVLGIYLNRVFQEFAIENSHTNALRKALFRLAACLVSLFLLLSFYESFGAGNTTMRMGFSALAGILSLLTLQAIATAYLSASRMLRPIHASQDRRIGGRIIIFFLLSGSLLIVGLYLPFGVYLLGLARFANTFSIILVGMGILFSLLASSMIRRVVSRAVGANMFL